MAHAPQSVRIPTMQVVEKSNEGLSRVIAVTISHGWEALGWCMAAERKAELRAMGIEVVTGIHALGDGVSSAFTEKSGGRTPDAATSRVW